MGNEVQKSRFPGAVRTCAEALIDLDAVRDNLGALRAPDVAQMAVVKADAYGHGAVPIAQAARQAGAEWLGVALPSEAIALRNSGDGGPILAWLYPPGDDHVVDCVAANVDLGVGAPWALDEIATAAGAIGRRARVHLKVDTGLGRGGAPMDAWPSLVSAAQRHSGNVEVVGVWSHLACADDPDSPETTAQVEAFAVALDTARRLGLEPQIRHLASSGAAMTRQETWYDLVRIGIAMYGIPPGPRIDMTGLRPAMTLTAHIAAIKAVPRGHGVSYGLQWRAPTSTNLALIPVGYADGIPRTAQGAQVWVGGQRVNVVGRIAMDQFVVDLGAVPAAPGDEVIVWGAGGVGEPTAHDWAQWDDTIGYEIVTRLGVRVPRRYVGR